MGARPQGAVHQAGAVKGKHAWVAIFAFALVHELTARRGELLSEEVDRRLITNRRATVLFGAVTVAHLFNVMPRRADPYMWLSRIMPSHRRTT